LERPTALVLLALLAMGAHGAILERGRIRCAGSETMAPLLSRWAEAFARRQPAVVFQMEGVGSRSAVQSLLSGSADLAVLSRPLLPQEESALRARFGDFAVQRAGTDTLRLLARSGGAASRHPAEAVAAFRRPSDKIRPAGRLPGSGTRYEALGMLGLERPAPGTLGFASPVALQNALRRDPSLVGYGSASLLVSGVVALPGPSLARPLLIVVPGTRPAPALEEFLRFARSEEGREIVRQTGFSPAADGP
jgi:hypothetical protein